MALDLFTTILAFTTIYLLTMLVVSPKEKIQ